MKRRAPLSYSLIRLIPAICLLIALSPLAALGQVVTRGKVVVLDPIAGRIRQGAVFLVDESGRRSLLSDLGDLNQGERLIGTNDLAVAPSGRLFYPSGTFVVRINPLTGNREIISNVDDPDQGPVGEGLAGIAVDFEGQIYVSDLPTNQLFKVDPDNGNRTVLSKLDDESQGPTILRGDRMLLETEDTILVLDRGGSKVVRVDLDTGERTLVTDFGALRSLSGFALEPSGNLLVTSFASRLLRRFDIMTQELTVVSDFEDLGLGPRGRILEGVVVDPSGRIFVADSQAELSLMRQGAIFEVDPVTGERTVLTDFADDTQGPEGGKPTTIKLAVPVTATPDDVRLARSVLIATERLRVQKDALVRTGNVFVNGASGDALINKAAETPEGYEVGANALKIKKDAVVGGDVLIDKEFKNQGMVLGTETIRDFPIFDSLPAVERPMAGGGNVVVEKDSVLCLTEGPFGKVVVKKEAILCLEPGVYDFEKLKVAKEAELRYQGPVVIRLEQAKFGKNSVLGPAEGSSLDAKDAVVHISGRFKTGKESLIEANIVGPDSDCKFGKASELIGFAYCRNISLGKAAEATLRNFLEDALAGLE